MLDKVNRLIVFIEKKMDMLFNEITDKVFNKYSKIDYGWTKELIRMKISEATLFYMAIFAPLSFMDIIVPFAKIAKNIFVRSIFALAMATVYICVYLIVLYCNKVLKEKILAKKDNLEAIRVLENHFDEYQEMDAYKAIEKDGHIYVLKRFLKSEDI